MVYHNRCHWFKLENFAVIIFFLSPSFVLYQTSTIFKCHFADVTLPGGIVTRFKHIHGNIVVAGRKAEIRGKKGILKLYHLHHKELHRYMYPAGDCTDIFF